jgi:hypothetical protein
LAKVIKDSANGGDGDRFARDLVRLQEAIGKRPDEQQALANLEFHQRTSVTLTQSCRNEGYLQIR